MLELVEMVDGPLDLRRFGAVDQGEREPFRCVYNRCFQTQIVASL